jgi:hypothetical protein
MLHPRQDGREQRQAELHLTGLRIEVAGIFTYYDTP